MVYQTPGVPAPIHHMKRCLPTRRFLCLKFIGQMLSWIYGIWSISKVASLWKENVNLQNLRGILRKIQSTYQCYRENYKVACKALKHKGISLGSNSVGEREGRTTSRRERNITGGFVYAPLDWMVENIKRHDGHTPLDTFRAKFLASALLACGDR